MRAPTLALFGLLLLSGPAQAQEIPLQASTSRTFTLVSQEQELPQAIVVYRQGNQNLVPLQALSAAVGLDIRVDAVQAKANGWIGGENSNFLLDIFAEEARRGFERFDIDPQQVWGRDSADLYIDARLIERILPLRLNFNQSANRLMVASDNPLPAVEQLKAQQANSARLGLQQNFHSGGFDPIHPHNYAAASKPTVLGFSNAAIVGDDILTQDYRFGFIASGDLAQQSYEFNYNKLAKERSEYRLRFSRDLNDYSRDWGFALGQYQLGDISYLGDNLLQGANEGFGFQIGDGRQHQFGVTTIEGNAPPFWEVHLYRNGVLMAITQAANSGRYFFSEQPLLAGANVFEMHLFGVNGEHQVRRKTINNSNQLDAGQFSYNVLYMDNESFVFNDRKPDERDDLGSLSQTGLRLSYGITDWWDLGVIVQSQTLALPTFEEQLPEDPEDPDSPLKPVTRYPDRTESYYGINSSFSLWKSQLELELINGDDATAYFAGFSRPLGDNLFIRASHRNNGDMATDLNSGLNPALSSNSELWLEGQTWRFGGWQYALGGELASPKVGDNYSVLSNRLSSQFGPVSFSHIYRYDGRSDDTLSRHRGELLLATNGFDWNLSTHLNYQWGEGLRDMETRLRWRPLGPVNNHSKLYYDKPGEAKSTFGFAHEIAYRYQWLTLGLESGIDNRGDWQLNGTATFAYNYRDNRNSDLSAGFRPQVADIAVRVYRDSNNNGRFDRTDQPLPGITIDAAPSWPRQVSDDTGTVMLKQVPANNLYRFGISGRALPQGMTLRNGVMEIMPIAGERNVVDLALVMISSVNGQVTDQHGNGIAQLELNITDLSQRRITSVSTDGEGNFFFPGLRPGQYYLIANPEQMRKRELSSAIPLYPLNISPSGEDRKNWQIQLQDANGKAIVAIAKPTPVVVPKPDPRLILRPSSDRLNTMSANDYVLQVAASSKAFKLASLQQQYPQMSLTQTKVMRAGKPVYLLLAGQYPSERSAELGRRDMPSDLSNGQPIPRRVADLRRESLTAPTPVATPSVPNLKPQTIPAAVSAPAAPGDDWLSQQPSDHLTWQVAAARSRDSASAFIKQHQLPQPWQIKQSNGWYQVLWGSFSDEQQAQQALEQLTTAPDQPWLRPFSAVR
ncbi:SPOR domain-containing protein [uncultured Ferrimonas sp.]|uniref:SPOR domain-containing protein n=1 Tax=uncultured Ferrimonas sp. TaxID=432640 RepID=UPI0026338359|nr:SPOR domain-containing protein [uncultured Ferrimonas sp.]